MSYLCQTKDLRTLYNSYLCINSAKFVIAAQERKNLLSVALIVRDHSTHRCSLRTTLYLSLWPYLIRISHTKSLACYGCQQKKSNYLLDAEVMLTEPWTILTSKDNLLPLCVQALDHHISTINTEIGIWKSVLY